MSNGTESFREYFAGGAVTFGLIIVSTEIYRFLLTRDNGTTTDLNQIFAVFFILHIISGFIGSYLVARKKQDTKIQIGIVTGVIGYMLEYVFYYLLEGLSLGGGILIIPLIIGGILGILYSKL